MHVCNFNIGLVFEKKGKLISIIPRTGIIPALIFKVFDLALEIVSGTFQTWIARTIF
jgi:hypothetical protein